MIFEYSMKIEIVLRLVARARKGRAQCNMHSNESKIPNILLLFIWISCTKLVNLIRLYY